jgi:hypothetical protein
VYERQEIDQHETNKEDTYIEEVRDEVIPEEESVPIQINKQVEEESPAEEMPNEPMESDIPIHKIRPIEEEREESRSRSYLLIKIILIIMAIGCISFTLISTGALDTLFPAFSGIYTKIIWLLGSTEYSK